MFNLNLIGRKVSLFLWGGGEAGVFEGESSPIQ